MIEKLEAKKRILNDALESAYRDLGEALITYGGGPRVEATKNAADTIKRKVDRVDAAIEECKAVEHVFYLVDTPPPVENPAPIPAVPADTNDIPF